MKLMSDPFTEMRWLLSLLNEATGIKVDLAANPYAEDGNWMVRVSYLLPGGQRRVEHIGMSQLGQSIAIAVRPELKQNTAEVEAILGEIEHCDTTFPTQ
jgi:hypothetical protein